MHNIQHEQRQRMNIDVRQPIPVVFKEISKDDRICTFSHHQGKSCSMFQKSKHEAACKELRFINQTGGHFDKPSYMIIWIACDSYDRNWQVQFCCDLSTHAILQIHFPHFVVITGYIQMTARIIISRELPFLGAAWGSIPQLNPAKVKANPAVLTQ